MASPARAITKSETMPVVGITDRTRKYKFLFFRELQSLLGFRAPSRSIPSPLSCTTNTLGSTESNQPEGVVAGLKQHLEETVTGKG